MISGFGMMAQTTMTNTIIQTTVTPAMRGRVISYFAMAYFGMMPLGSLLVGFVSQYIGAAHDDPCRRHRSPRGRRYFLEIPDPRPVIPWPPKPPPAVPRPPPLPHPIPGTLTATT